jgi:hypothetical protein
MSPVSFATINPGNFELTPCRVNFKGVDLGATLGNVKVVVKDKLSDLKADQLGSTVINRKNSGFECTVETSIAESQAKSNWKVIFPAHHLVTDPNTGKQNVYFDSQVGASQTDFSGPLILHPLSRPNSDLSGDVMIYLATANGASEYEFGPEKQIAMKIHWDMYPDFTTQPPRFLVFGDPSIGTVAASAGSATAGTGNTGNGTVTGISVFSGTTETETVTLKCVTAGTGGAFFVSGSLAGALGLATVGVGFSSAQIAFTINNGGTPFVVGDSFAISTTAANYS